MVNYKNDPSIDIENICKVDYPIKGNLKYNEVINEKFNYCVSSHNIEHSPCIVTFLQNISSVLEYGGLIFLAIPDYRYCFDHYRKPSDIFEVLEKYYNKNIKPRSYERLEGKFNKTHNDSNKHWETIKKTYQNSFQKINDEYSFLNNQKENIINSIEYIKNIIETDKESEYIDTHCWKLTPFFFHYLIEILFKTQIIDLYVERIYKTLAGSHEFYVILKKISN
jgi:hypothetical protein